MQKFFKPSPSVRLVLSVAALAVGIAGCSPADQGSTAQSSTLPTQMSSNAARSTPAEKPTPETDFRRLLLTAADLSDAEDTFAQRSQAPQPNGLPGASAFFVNDKDNRAISDTVSIYPDAAKATEALQQDASTLSTKVIGGTPKPVAVGTGGVMVVGSSPDEDKAVTLMSFTHGRALVRLEFQSAKGDPTTDQFVTGVGKMQQIALRIGLPESE